jgi:hypothetical protein
MNCGTLKMEAVRFSETSVLVSRSTRRYVPEDNALHGQEPLSSTEGEVFNRLKFYEIFQNQSSLRICLVRLSPTDMKINFLLR